MTSFYDCEIYDIATGIWTQITPTNYPHEYHTADYNQEEGTILVVGSSYAPHNSCEIYDFATGIWTPIDTLEIGRWNHCSEKLLNNKILVIGGTESGSEPRCEIYNPDSNQWQTAASTYYSYGNFSSEVLFDERILAIRRWCEIYTWNYTPQVSQPQTLNGLNEALVGDILTFSVIASDPDNDSIAVRIDWDDGEFSEWTELQPSGTTFELSHSWTEPGVYEVRAQVADQWYFLNELCHNSISEWSEPYVITIIPGQSSDPAIELMPKMSAYPNPFDKSTTVCFYGAVNSHENARIEIYNIKGKKIRTLENLECINRVNAKTIPIKSGFYSISWNGRDDKNRPVTSGIYFYKLMIGENEIASNKMLLLK